MPAILLSLKYKVDENAVFDMLAETEYYVSHLDEVLIEGLSDEDYKPEIDFSLAFNAGTSTKTTLAAFSEKYGIPQNIIASIYIDYISVKENLNNTASYITLFKDLNGYTKVQKKSFVNNVFAE